MVFLLLAGCGPRLGDHCVTTRAPGGDIRDFTTREMQHGRSVNEAIYFSVLGEPAALATNVYEDGLWVSQSFNDYPTLDEPTRETVLEWDAEERVVSREVISLPEGTSEGSFTYTWEGDRLVSTHSETLFTTWDETWSWSGDTATIERVFLGGRVVVEIREYASSPLSWPLLNPDRDLPGLAFLSIGVDDDASGRIEEGERIWEQELDENGIPSFSRFFDATGAVFSQIEWGACPEAPGPA
ncbi:MAG: hypothetical protein R3F61_20305 [Myxococcota bacterium]